MSREDLRYADTKKQDTTFSGTEQDYQDPLVIDKILESTNVAEELSEDDLISIGNLVVDGYETDLISRAHWEKDLETWTKLALQVVDQKTYPCAREIRSVSYPSTTKLPIEIKSSSVRSSATLEDSKILSMVKGSSYSCSVPANFGSSLVIYTTLFHFTFILIILYFLFCRSIYYSIYHKT